eukprot:1643259-Amphidinium_carterae.1
MQGRGGRISLRGVRQGMWSGPISGVEDQPSPPDHDCGQAKDEASVCNGARRAIVEVAVGR